ncbi:hypothetical protein HDA43_002613 [Streptosporangium sandarakinum]|uniref:Uncharacterized protein n=1 Tax=Streptosporangium sandarakinum TaxID=1260955 RepID=A0A852UZK1_9ACTN|nr:hypothetical protein [Streptosporangium sandarakinum]
MRGQWPAGANDITPGKPLHTCVCGAISSSPINHDHSRK